MITLFHSIRTTSYMSYTKVQISNANFSFFHKTSKMENESVKDAPYYKGPVKKAVSEINQGYKVTLSKQIRRISVPPHGTKFYLEIGQRSRSRHGSSSERACHKDHACQISMLYK